MREWHSLYSLPAAYCYHIANPITPYYYKIKTPDNVIIWAWALSWHKMVIFSGGRWTAILFVGGLFILCRMVLLIKILQYLSTVRMSDTGELPWWSLSDIDSPRPGLWHIRTGIDRFGFRKLKNPRLNILVCPEDGLCSNKLRNLESKKPVHNIFVNIY